MRNRVSSKAFSFFTSGQGESTRTWRVITAIYPLSSPPLSTYLDPLHVKVGVVRSPVPRVHAAVDLHHKVLNPSRTNRLTWEVFLSGFCKTLPLREEIIMVAEVEAEAVADMIELSLLNVC